MSDVRVGLVGLGRFGRLHARVLSELPGCRLVAFCETNEKSLSACGIEHGVESLYTDLEQMLSSEDLDAVDIVTDESSHGRQAMLALEREAAVFVEKPLATDAEEAQNISRMSRDLSLPVIVGNVSRFDARYAVLRRELEAGKFGQVSLVQARRSFSRAWFSGFGNRVHPVFESMIHDLDLVLWYLPSPVSTVYAQATNGAPESQTPSKNVPDTLVAVLTAEDGALAVLQSNWLLPDAAPITLTGSPSGVLDLVGTIDAQLEVVGSSQVGRVDLLAGGPALWSNSGVRNPDAGLWPEVHGRIVGALQTELAHFIECAKTNEPSSIAPPEVGAAAVRLAEAIVSSSELGEPVRLEEAWSE